MDGAALLEILQQAAGAVTVALAELEEWGEAGTRPGQYLSDLAADAAACRTLLDAGLGVLSEESGLIEPGRALLAVLDPLDGSTNASRGIPWFATSICVLDEDGPLAALVVNQATGAHYEAVRGEGARRDGRTISPSGCVALGEAIIGISGQPPKPFCWRQFRALGAAALDLCAVADGTLDGYLDCSVDAHGPWDYLAGTLICSEAGAEVADATGRELAVREHDLRRTPVAGATPRLLESLLSRRDW
jgi:myo-inositol-1(or 4)-monophosphatase